MKTLGWFGIAISVGAITLPLAAGAAWGDGEISDTASLDRSMGEFRGSQPVRVAWYNPYLPEASVSYVAPGEDAADGTAVALESADGVMERIVASYRRDMLDRGGWENPHLSVAAAGNPVLAVAAGSGVTLQGIAAAPAVAGESRDEGSASGEPEMAPGEDSLPARR